MVANIFGSKLASPDTVMPAAGYVHYNDKNWWIPSGKIQYLNAGMIRSTMQKPGSLPPCPIRDPLGTVTTVQYYQDYFLLLQSVTDVLQSVIKVEQYNFRTLSPVLFRDINDNLSQAIYDELGMIKAVAILGKDLDHDNVAELQLCDDLTGLTEVTGTNEANAIQAYFAQGDSVQLMTQAAQLIQHATSRWLYDLGQYAANGKPAAVSTILREEHYTINPNSKLQCRFEYSDGITKYGPGRTHSNLR